MNSLRYFDVQQHEAATLLRFVEARLFDTRVVSELQDELIEYLETHRPQLVAICFENVTQCSTSVINAMLRAKKRVLASGGQIRLCSMAPQVRDAYQILNLDGTVFDIDDVSGDSLARLCSTGDQTEMK